MFLMLGILCHVFCTVYAATLQTPSTQSCARLGLGAGQPQYGCTNSIDWRGDGYNNNDCRAVVQRFFFAEVTEHGSQEFEFLAPGANRTTGKDVKRTPRRYTVGKCTLAIVMLDFFPEGSLPGEMKRPFDPDDTDVVSFNGLWLVADLIETCCLLGKHQPGWASAGLYDSIGIFIWTASSPMDRAVPPGVPTFQLPANLTASA